MKGCGGGDANGGGGGSGCVGCITGLPQKEQNFPSFTIICPQFEQNKISPPLTSSVINTLCSFTFFQKKSNSCQSFVRDAALTI